MTSFDDDDWTSLTKEKIKSKIISEFKEEKEIEAANQAYKQQLKCNNGT